MRRFLLFLALLFIFMAQARPQDQAMPGNAPYPDITLLMAGEDANFYHIQAELEGYWATRVPSKGNGWKQYKRWQAYWETRIDPDGSFPKPMRADRELRKFLQLSQGPSKSPTGSWSNLGPVTMPFNGTSQPNGLGRLNTIAFHPSDSNTLWVGSPSGGLWKTTDHGQSWVILTDTLPTLGVSSILIDPNNTQVIYIGSGDRDGGDAPGKGVLKSTNGGQTWAYSNSGMGSKVVGEMVMSPSNSSHILAATSGGIYKSTNAGSSWTLTSSNTDYYKDIVLKPGSGTVVYAAAEGNFYRSTDFGSTWSQVSSGLPTGSNRLVIGVSSANSNYVYCLYAASDNKSYGGTYRSTNSGLSFSTMSTTPNIMGYSTDGSTTGGQAWYDLAIAVDPSDANTVYAGGINIWKSTNGGQTWSLNAHWVGSAGAAPVHADIHYIAFSPVSAKLYNCNDGGLYYTLNGGNTWPEISNGLSIAQVYRIGQSASSQNIVINGYQDNGTAVYNNGTWSTEIGGDGMECIIDPDNANYLYGALYYGDIRRSTNGGSSFSGIAGDGVNGINESGAWVTPYILDANNSSTMYAGYKNLWRSTNVKTGNPNSVSWTRISNNLGGSNTYTIRVLEQSTVDTDVLYMARADNSLFRTDNLSSSSPTWTDITNNLPNNSIPLDLEAHPDNQNVVYLAQSGKVYKSTNKGASWADISGNLPITSINCIVIDTAAGNDALYVGTDLGVYYRDNSLTSWISFSDGLPYAAEVTELEIWYHPSFHSLSKIRAATYGRGLWSSDLFSSAGQPPLAYFGADTLLPCVNAPVQLLDSSWFNPTSWSWSITPSTFTYVTGTSTSQNPVVAFTQPGNYSITLTATNSNGSNAYTRPAYIHAGGLGTPFTEDFETSASRKMWTVINPDAGKGWETATVGGNAPGSTAMYMDFYAYSNTGQRDTLISPPINLSGWDSADVSFEHAYALYSTSYKDSLIVLVSANCGSSWTRLAAYGDDGSGSFATHSNTTSPFTPATSTDWCGSGYGASCITLDLSPWAGMSGIRLAFVAYNGYSNNLYIDNINVNGYSLGPMAAFTATPQQVCSGDTVFLQNNSTNASLYTWLVNGIPFSTSANASYIIPTLPPGSTNIEFGLVAGNGTVTDTTYANVTGLGMPLPAGEPSGTQTPCAGAGPYTFTINAVGGATGYQWVLTPDSAGTITPNDTTADVTFAANYMGIVAINVVAYNPCDTAYPGLPHMMLVSTVPGNANQPAGPSFLCQDPPNTTYTIDSVPGALAYQWTLMPSWAGSIVGTDTFAVVDWDSAYTGNARIIAFPVNPCGIGQGMLDTTVIGGSPAVPATPGGPIQACQNSDSTIFVIPSATFATSYEWELSPASAGAIYGTTEACWVDWDNSFTGQAQVRVKSMNACDTSTWSGYHDVDVKVAPATPVITRSNDTLYSSEFYGNLWYDMSGATTVTTNYFIPPSAGWYYVVVTNGYGCAEASANFWYSPVGIEEADQRSLRVYPNPTQDLVIIDANFSFDKVRVYTLAGAEVEASLVDERTLSIGSLAAGTYMLSVIAPDGRVFNARIARY